MVVITKTKWLKSTTELQTCLGVNFKNLLQLPRPLCHKVNLRQRTNNLTSASALLQRLASLALCKRSHQSQAVEKATQWDARVKSYLQAGDETEVKVSVRPQRTTTTTITPPSTPVTDKREERQAATTRSSRRSAAPPPVAARRATRAPRGSTPSTAIHLEEDSEEDSGEEETIPEPEPIRSRTRGAAGAPSAQPNGRSREPRV
ncbi:hypothetical protein CSAL01_10321 [Colletotrichum salicis]|uniref:Uncharacterized protein n=1 Tax=Colletotrichum salicis TaxID=1209931 RepID=A0A135V408_9PEZI|nr:hypothetical protein CSAL01_10321 [Colletotrichum salicis]